MSPGELLEMVDLATGFCASGYDYDQEKWPHGGDFGVGVGSQNYTIRWKDWPLMNLQPIPVHVLRDSPDPMSIVRRTIGVMGEEIKAFKLRDVPVKEAHPLDAPQDAPHSHRPAHWSRLVEEHVTPLPGLRIQRAK